MSAAHSTGRLLIVSYWFPPFHAVAALRMGKLAKYLLETGWDVRVLAADETNPASMPLEIDKGRILYTPWRDVDRLLEGALGRLRGAAPASLSGTEAANAQDAAPARTGKPAWRKFARQAYQEIVRLPDNRAGWIRPALAAGERLCGEWRPDVIYATAPPPTSLIVAQRLAARRGVPWVAEFRDLWSDHPYYEYSGIRRFFERMWDQRVVTSSSAIVTVSPIWQPRLQARYGRPTVTAMNGYDIADFPEMPPVAPDRTGPLRIVYTGHIYRGHRDPAPLFEALRRLGARPEDVVVEFVGSDVDSLRRIAAGAGVSSLVRFHPPVGYREALSIQLHADVLLHLQWCDPKEEGTIAGKLFDYLAARRPILGIALEDSVVAKLVHDRKAGLVTNDPGKIAEQVAAWIKAKMEGGVPPLPPSAHEGLDRTSQFAKIASLLSEILRETTPSRTAAVRRAG